MVHEEQQRFNFVYKFTEAEKIENVRRMMRLNNPPAPTQEDALEDDGYRRRRNGAKGALHAFEESGFYRPRK